MLGSLEALRLSSSLTLLLAEIREARHDVPRLQSLAKRLSRVAAEITESYEIAFAGAIQASAA